MASKISNIEDYIDSRDIEKRIEELEEYRKTEGLDDCEQKELDNLKNLKDQADGAPDWAYGETLIRASVFLDYVTDLCQDCGYIPKDFPWWIIIDWDATAKNVALDYITVDFDGVDYYIRY